MAHQEVRNGPLGSRDRQGNGVIEGVSSCGNDLATLAVLQLRLAVCDLRESAKVAIPILAGLMAFTLTATSSAVVGLAGTALWLATILSVQVSIVMMVVALVGLVISILGGALLARALSRSFTYFRRSQEELERNLAWVRTTLV